MPHPEGYRKALRLMRLAAKFGAPVITLIDTPGATGDSILPLTDSCGGRDRSKQATLGNEDHQDHLEPHRRSRS